MMWWWMVVSGVLCSDCPLPGSIRVAAWITSSSGSRQRRRDHDGEMVRWWDMTDHTQHWLGRVTSSLLPHCCCYTFLHTFMLCLHYLISSHLSWEGHRRTCPSHSLSLISNIFCQNWTNTFAHLSYTVSLGLPMEGLTRMPVIQVGYEMRNVVHVERWYQQELTVNLLLSVTWSFLSYTNTTHFVGSPFVMKERHLTTLQGVPQNW